MRYLTLPEVLQLHQDIVEQTGGTHGVRDLGALESSLAQLRQTFGGLELYPTLAEKAGSLGFSLIQNHPFVDGNKRIGHAAMETFLMLNGAELDASVDESEKIVLLLASGNMSRDAFVVWIVEHSITLRLGDS